MFNAEIYFLVFRGHIFAKQLARNKWGDSVDSKGTKIPSTNLPQKVVLNAIGYSSSRSSSWSEKKMLANIGSRGEPIATPPTWMWKLLLNVKNDSLLNHANQF